MLPTQLDIFDAFRRMAATAAAAMHDVCGPFKSTSRFDSWDVSSGITTNGGCPHPQIVFIAVRHCTENALIAKKENFLI